MGRKKYEARHGKIRITTIKKKIVVITSMVATLILLLAGIIGSAYVLGSEGNNEETSGEVLYTIPDGKESEPDNEVEVTLNIMSNSELDFSSDSQLNSEIEKISDAETDSEFEVAFDSEIEAENKEISDTEVDEEVVDSEDDAALSYTPYEYSLFTRLLTAEAGGEAEDELIATAWVIRNRVTSFGGYEEAIFLPNAFEPANVFYGEIALRSGYIITDDDVPENVKRVAEGVLTGEIPSPVEDWEFFLGFRTMGYEDGDEFAAKYSIEEYSIIGNTIFFKGWNEELNIDF